jgi:hypothetical protein
MENEANLHLISKYYDEFKESIPVNHRVDEVTWNDLEMDNIFHRIDTCSSFAGEQILYTTLHRQFARQIDLEQLECKVEHFAANPDERLSMQLLLCQIGKDEVSYYLPNFLNNLDAFQVKGIYFYRVMQIVLALSFLPAILFHNPIYLVATAILFLTNMVIYTLKKMQYEIYLQSLGSITRIVKAARRIVSNSKDCSYEALFSDLEEMVQPFHRLIRMIGQMQANMTLRYSGDMILLLYDYIIGATLRDFTTYARVIKVLKGKREDFRKLFETLGEIDMAISIASFRESLPLYCKPSFNKERCMELEGIYHPLIDDPVYNSITLTRNGLITGSNASGKSTFIKAVAINAILAQSIYTCTANRLLLQYGQVITSMTVRDDLTAGESYYIKEIKYLNRIIQSFSKDRLVICVIDEILRGTNTKERIAAAYAILQYINRCNCIALVATHDIELTELLQEGYENFHFHETIQDRDILFDYRLYNGPSDTQNAIKLLDYGGFPEDIIRDAQKGITYC